MKNEELYNKILDIHNNLLSLKKQNNGYIIIPNNDKIDIYTVDVEHLIEYLTIENMRLKNDANNIQILTIDR